MKTKHGYTFLAAALIVAALAAGAFIWTGVADQQDQQAPATGDMIATVTRVIDGDTFVTGTGARVRILGLDAPEIYHPSNGQGTNECYGIEASGMLTVLLGDQVSLAVDPFKPATDDYGRALRYVTTQDGRDVTQVMIAGGWAKYYGRYPVGRSDIYKLDQDAAKANRLGGWAECGW